MLRIAICDDECYYVEEVAGFVKEWASSENLIVQLQKFRSGEELLADMEINGDFSFVFLDIEMSGMNGIETAVKIRENSRYIGIIFISQYDHYCKAMLDLGHVYLIEKPILREKTISKLNQMMKDYRFWHENFTFQYDRHTYSIPLHEVAYFTSEKRKIRIIMNDMQEYCFYEKLDELEKILTKYKTYFIRIHKSFLVNSECITEFRQAELLLNNGCVLTISKEHRHEIAEFHMKLLM